MHDASGLYRTFIEDFCRAAGIEASAEVERTRHLEVDGRLIGLIPSDGPGEPMLSVFIEIARSFEDRDAPAWRRMLEANVTADPAEPGCLGLHPQSGQAVWCMRVPLRDADPQELARLVESRLHTLPDLARQLALA